MPQSIPLVEIWRGDFLESLHRGHAVVYGSGGVIASWGDPDLVILPRSSCKMIQALPLIESGAADAFGLTSEQLALSCASHQGAAMHTDRVSKWLDALDLTDDDFRCGPQIPNDLEARERMIKEDALPCQMHNNCSGKHSGFLTLNKHLGGGSEYIDPTHKMQITIKAAFEDMTGEVSPGHAIDGCSAPNFATSVTGLARGMYHMANPTSFGRTRSAAAERLVSAMREHPLLVAGTTRACSELMQAMEGATVVKTGAEGVFAAILPEQQIGVALKIEDGTPRAAEAAMAALLVRLGVLDAKHPSAVKRLNPPVLNRRDVVTGYIQPTEALFKNGAPI